MASWEIIRKYLWLVVILFSVFIFVYSVDYIVTALCIIGIVVTAVVYLHYESKSMKQKFSHQLVKNEQEHLAMLSKQRHDSLNDVQVLLGYIRLDNKDKSLEYVDKIKARAHQDSVIAKLNDYQLVTYINELDACNFNVEFEIEIISDNISWTSQCSLFLIEVIANYEKFAVIDEQDDQQLMIYIAIHDDIYIQFEYNGQLMDTHAWKLEIENIAAKLIHEKRIILTIDEQDINSTFLA